MKKLALVVLGFSIFLHACNVSISNSSSKDNILRLFSFNNSASNHTELKLSIQGTVKDSKGNPVPNALIPLSSESLSTSTSVQRTTNLSSIRCVDYDTRKGKLMCLLVLKTKNLNSGSSCLKLYYGKKEDTASEAIATFSGLKSGDELRLVHQRIIPELADRFLIYSCDNQQNTLLSSETFTDVASGTISDASGNYTLALSSGKKHSLSIQTPSTDLGSISIDLSNYTSKESLEELRNDSTKLIVSTSGSIQIEIKITEVKSESIAEAKTTVETNTTTETATTSISGITVLTDAIKTDPVFTIENPPLSLSYNSSSFTFAKNSSITTLSPIVTGGNPTSYSISPALPSGLSFNTNTGQISGIPSGINNTQTFTITGMNSSGSVSTSLSITVNDIVPAITYTSNTHYFTINAPITTLGPTVSGGVPTSYSITPALPSGLSFNTNTGQISGTPTVISNLLNYTVTASNSGGNASTVLYIGVEGLNYVLDFDGVDDRLTTSTMIPYNSSTFTIAAWIKTSAGGIIFSWGSPVVSNYTTLEVYLGKVRCAIGNSNLNKTYVDGVATVNTASWIHIAVVKRANDAVDLYVNGILDFSGTVNSLHYTNSPTDTSIGGGLINNIYQTFFTGKIEDLSIWNVEKSSAEILALKTTPPLGNEAGLVAYYRFNTGSGTAVPDNSTAGTYSGTLYNFALTGTASNWIQEAHP